MVWEQPQFRAAIAVSLGAIGGALCRYYAGQIIALTWTASFPLETFVANLGGCFLMGVVTTLAMTQAVLNPERMLLITTGFLGSFTTFSSYELDVSQLWDMPGVKTDLMYWLGSPVFGLLCLWAGVVMTQKWFTAGKSDR